MVDLTPVESSNIARPHSRKEAALNAPYLRSVLYYDHGTGRWLWLNPTSSACKKGDEAGCRGQDGYIRIRLNGFQYYAHRLAVLYMTGEWPPHEVDHADLDRANNRWLNLRCATTSQNKGNRKALRGNKSGFKGVRFRAGAYEASICRDKKTVYLGRAPTAELAFELYRSAAARYFGEYFRA